MSYVYLLRARSIAARCVRANPFPSVVRTVSTPSAPFLGPRILVRPLHFRSTHPTFNHLAARTSVNSALFQLSKLIRIARGLVLIAESITRDAALARDVAPHAIAVLMEVACARIGVRLCFWDSFGRRIMSNRSQMNRQRIFGRQSSIVRMPGGKNPTIPMTPSWQYAVENLQH